MCLCLTMLRALIFLEQIELLCDKLSAAEITSLSNQLGGPAFEEGGGAALRADALAEVRQCAVETAAGAERQSLLAIQRRDRARQEAADRAREAKLAHAAGPWSKEELAALAKGVKKYPAGGSNRWGAIATFVNNLCKLPTPRTKEECIEKYNQLASSAALSAPTEKAEADSSSCSAKNVNQSTERPWTDEEVCDFIFALPLTKCHVLTIEHY